jgi:hypothetical protein
MKKNAMVEIACAMETGTVLYCKLRNCAASVPDESSRVQMKAARLGN